MNPEWLQLEKISNAVYFNHVDDQDIFIYSIKDLKADVLVHWGKHVVSCLTADNPPPVYRVLYDLSHPSVSMAYLVLTGRNLFNIGITPRGRFLLDQFLQAHPALTIDLALVLSDAASGRIAARHQINSFHDQVTGKVFFEREPAIEWLIRERSTFDMKYSTRPIEVPKNLQDTDNDDGHHANGHAGAAITSDNSIVLLIEGTVERVEFDGQSAVVVGRGGQNTDANFLDVSSYGQPARSVSRQHLKIERVGQYIYITDLHSSNGTYLNGEKLKPGESHPLMGDHHIQVGALSMTIRF
jgi:hypothetical protein